MGLLVSYHPRGRPAWRQVPHPDTKPAFMAWPGRQTVNIYNRKHSPSPTDSSLVPPLRTARNKLHYQTGKENQPQARQNPKEITNSSPNQGAQTDSGSCLLVSFLVFHVDFFEKFWTVIFWQGPVILCSILIAFTLLNVDLGLPW